MSEYLQFSTRSEFREWLSENVQLDAGVWLLFGKKGEPKTLNAAEALEEALCFGWIDGQMKNLDENSYVKYFSPRRAKSKWSDKNKSIVDKLEEQGIMTEHGRAKIEEAKKYGQWDAPKAPPITVEDIAKVSDMLKGYEPAYSNYLAMPPSIKKTYARAYLDAKTDEGREKRLSWMIDRLNKNLKSM